MAVPVSMRGLATNPIGGPDSLPGGYIADPYETTPELMWPRDLAVYDYMRRTDSQSRALLKAAALPILGTEWTVVGKKCRPEVIAFVKAELGLVEDENGRRRSREGGVVWDEFLRHAMLMLPMGFMAFERLYAIGVWELDDAHPPPVTPDLPPVVVVDETKLSEGALKAPPVLSTGVTQRAGAGAPNRSGTPDTTVNRMLMPTSPLTALPKTGPPAPAKVHNAPATPPDPTQMSFPDPMHGGPVAHLRALAPRMPRTISRPEVNDDGNLVGLWQAVHRLGQTNAAGRTDMNTPVGQLGTEVFLPRARLVLFVNEQEGSNFTGMSVFRVAYKHWMIKDALIRVGAMSVDRNGMGVPVVTFPSDAGTGAKARALAIATAVRAGEDSGVALEEGWTLSLLGVHGSVVDALKWVEYHDQAQSRSMLAMFLDLGHDNGARALGDTFVDYFLLSERAILRYLEEVITEQVIRDLVRVNFGEHEVYPTVVAQDVSNEQSQTARALAELAKAGLLRPDDSARAYTRKRMGLPPEDDGVSVDGHDLVDEETIIGDPLMQRSTAMALRGLVGAGIPLAEAMKMIGVHTPPDGYNPAAVVAPPAAPGVAPAAHTRRQSAQMVVPGVGGVPKVAKLAGGADVDLADLVARTEALTGRLAQLLAQ